MTDQIMIEEIAGQFTEMQEVEVGDMVVFTDHADREVGGHIIDIVGTDAVIRCIANDIWNEMIAIIAISKLTRAV